MKSMNFKELFSTKEVKSKRQRKEILIVFLNLKGHKSFSQIYLQVSKICILKGKTKDGIIKDYPYR